LNIIRFERINSTQDYAKEHISSFTEPTIIIAKEQTEGKGRYGRRFLSPEGGLYLSFVIELDFPSLNIVAPLGIAESLSRIGIETKILWPNDIIYKGKKIGGVIIERIDKKIIIGIGINCNNRIDDFDEYLRENITTIYEIKKEKIDIEELGISIVEQILYLMKDYEFLKDLYERRMEGIGKKVKIIKDDGEEIKGIIKGINENGELILRNNDNKSIVVISAKKLILPD